jgi:exosortase
MEARRAWLGPAGVGLLGVIAYRPYLLGVLATDYQLESWFFRPSQLPPLLVLAVAGWLLWRRRERLCPPGARPAPFLAVILAGLGTAAFVWATLTRAADLLPFSISAVLLAFAAATGGWAACRAALLPAGVLLLGAQIPTPLQHEIVWRLQVGTASGAGWLLGTLGQEFVQSGVVLRNPDNQFHVIDNCSGFNGIATLTIVALLVRELFADSGWRQWLLVALAPILGFALNIVRVAYVAASPDPEAMAADHTSQGLAVLVAGTGLLYALGWAMAQRSGKRSSRAKRDPGQGAPRAPWGLAAVGLALLAVLTLALPRFEPTDRTTQESVEFPMRKPGWASEIAPPDPLFLGYIPGRVHRRYEPEGAPPNPPQFVDVLVGFKLALVPESTPLLSSKLSFPGPDWDLVSRSRERLWLLEREADLAIASRGPGGEHAVVYAWRPHDGGLWRESWRSLLALESSPFRRERSRVIVRLVAYAPHDGQLVLDQAKQRLDRFIREFREELAAL